MLLTKTNAQSVGINNNTPHASAALDVTSTTKGVLIPRLTQAQRLAIASPAKGLLVFDSTSNSFWYNNGSSWQQIGAANNAWNLTGNAGINPVTQFIGTTDVQPLRFRLNNVWAGELNVSNSEVALGYGAGQNNTSGAYNVAIGTKALNANTTGNTNTATGTGSLSSNTNGSYNTATGGSSLSGNISGNSNTATGSNTLLSNTTGSLNTTSGVNSLFSNTTGSGNTANGVGALNANTTGYSNVAVGLWALQSSTFQSNLVAIGDSALFNNGLGVSAGADATGNTAIGSKALYSNVSGYGNSATGRQALYSNTSGHSNTGNGNQALYSNTTGLYNTATGYQALYNNTTGSLNTGNGYLALYSNTMGSENTAFGYYALLANTTGEYNTAIGKGADVSSGDLMNATVIGADAVVNGSNKVRIGDAFIAVIEGQVDWSFPSDGRFKTNITETVKGLDFIMRLRPVVYNFQTKKYDEFIRGDVPNKAKLTKQQDFSKSESIRHSGFVAQEVEKAAKEASYDFNGVIVPENNKQTYSLAYGQFVVPLVKAVQELAKMNDELQKRLEKVEALLAAK